MTAYKDGYLKDPELIRYMEELYKDVHQHPELSMQEHRTTELIKRHLAELGLELQDLPGLDVGAVAIMRGAEPGPCLLIRADIDALPLDEDNDLPYKSTVPGVMHACGHDSHLAILLGTIKYLVETGFQKRMRGVLKFCFQPAEEHICGAKKQIDAGVLEDPHVDMAIMLHSDPTLPPGEVALFECGSYSHANSDMFHIVMNGKGGHSSRPDKTEDLILAGSYLVNILQSIVARGIDPRDAAVVSVCTFHAGDAPNVFPAELKISGTVRTFKPEVQEFVIRRMGEICDTVAGLHGIKVKLDYTKGVPSVPIDREAEELLRSASLDVLPDDCVTTQGAGMGGEDFAYFAQKVPGGVLRLGTGPSDGSKWGSAHSPKYRLNLAGLPVGASIFVRAAERYLGKK